jgi:isopentenyl-diphosphate Delta-isomerase
MAGELFEIFDERGRRIGVAERSRVHREGLWHRAAHVWLFDGNGRLWIQRRAAAKDICPGCWDFSVGEHLKPGESFAAAARRGLHEELAVTGVALLPIGPRRRAKHEDAERGIRDWEETQAYRGVYDGPLRGDPAEVMTVRAIDLLELARWMRREPGAFTPWFVDEADALRVLPDVR